MRSVQGKIRTLLAQQSGQIQLLIIAPILTLAFLGLVVRTASSAIDPSLEKKKVTQQLKQRLNEVRNAESSHFAFEARNREGIRVTKLQDFTEPFQSISGRNDLSLLDLRPQNETRTALGGQSNEQNWQVIRGQTFPETEFYFLTPLTSPFNNGEEGQTIVSVSKSEEIWRIIKGNPRQIPLLASLATAPAFARIEKPWGSKAKVHDNEEVRKAIESQTPKKTPAFLVITASIAPLPLLPAIQPSGGETPLPLLPQKVSYRIKKNETPEKIFKRIGISSAETAQWMKAARKLKEFRSLRPGQVLEFSFADEIEQHALKIMSYEMGEGSRLILQRKTEGGIETKRETPPSLPVWLVIGGRVERSLAKSARKTGLPVRIINAMEDLEWDLHLSELHTGDSFKVLVEAVQRNEKIVEYKSLLAAEVSKKGQVYTAFSIPEEKLIRGKKGENQEEGLDIESEGQRFLRHPLEFTRISSSFSEARLHPILGYARPHTGVDFAAPRGTAVQAVASGTVILVGRQAGYGNIVRIDHPGPYDTTYAHLQGFAEGIEEGVTVEQGQVLGYVGSTGLATGPHLHFELLKDGNFVNPLTEKSLTGEPVKVVKEQPKPVVDPIIAEKKKRLADQLAALEIEEKRVISLIIPLQSTFAPSGMAAAEHKSGRRGVALRHASSGEIHGLSELHGSD